MTLDAKQRTVTTAQFKKNFPINVYSIPTLGPLEDVEELLTDQYVTQSIGTRRAHRMFRNIWFRWKKEFPVFQKLVEDTWEGMTISRPELDLSYPPKFSMFCTEGRVDRELCWAGFGFQVWLQLLTHITNAATVVPIGGFSQRQRIQNAAWTFEKVLKAEIAISAVLDRDYRCKEETEELIREARTTTPHFHVLAGKEIENYLLVAPAILRAISERLKEQRLSRSYCREELDSLISSVTDEAKSQVLSQQISNRMRYFDHRTSKDPATVASEAISLVDSDWIELPTRLLVVPGKQVLAGLNTHLQGELGVSITSTQIIRHMKTEEVSTDLRQILADLNEFAKGNRSARSAA